jgi:hypothetical protein
VATQVIVLNGGSSSGKSGIARCLQAILPDPWLAFGTDNLIQAMPMSLQTAAGIEFGQDGEVIVGPEFRTLEAAPSGVTPPWPRAASSPGATGSSGWPRPRPNWSTAVSSTTCR